MDKELGGSEDTRIDALWKQLDKKGKGRIDVRALQDGLKKIKHPLSNAHGLLSKVIESVDTNNDGEIELQEFRTFVHNAEKHLWDLFKSIDRDNNNRLDKDEMREAFKRSDITVSNSKLDDLFKKVDSKNDGVISFDEWRDFLLFIPAQDPTLQAVLSYFSATYQISADGDVMVSDEAEEGLGTTSTLLSHIRNSMFGAFQNIYALPVRDRPPDSRPTSQPPSQPSQHSAADAQQTADSTALTTQDGTHVNISTIAPDAKEKDALTAKQSQRLEKKWVLTGFLPGPGYYVCGATSGAVSRTLTAPLDRLKVYLIAQTDGVSAAVNAAKSGSPVQATKQAARPLANAMRELWKAGGVTSLWAGNGLNVLKVMPESAIKFGAFEGSKRALAKFEGHDNPKKLHWFSSFIAGGTGGSISQAFVYPIDTLKFRMQCETVEGGLHGNALISETARRMWAEGGIRPFYRGLGMGIAGMFPYAAIDLGTFDLLKKWLIRRRAKQQNVHEDDISLGGMTTAGMGGFSGAIGATIVYPINLLRTRLQTQGTKIHRRTYTGVADVWHQTIAQEGYRGLFRGLTPNLFKVVPAVSITYVVYENSKKALNLK